LVGFDYKWVQRAVQEFVGVELNTRIGVVAAAVVVVVVALVVPVHKKLVHYIVDFVRNSKI